VALVGRAEREGDLAIGRGIDLLGVEGLEKADGLCKPRLELIFLLVAKACALSRTPDSALRPISRDGREALDMENDI
jgi:hypothetical protein